MPSNLLRKVQKVEKRQNNRYEKFGFTQNPFPRKPSVIVGDTDYRQNGNIYLEELRQSETQQFEQILIPHPDRADTKTIAFLMDYATKYGRGIGKTAFLNYQKKRIQKDLGKALTQDQEIMFALYIFPNPEENYRNLDQ